MNARPASWREALPLAWAYYNEAPSVGIGGPIGNAAGGSLHIVLDDGNVEDSHVRFCIQWARDRDDAAGVALGELLLTMSRTQRARLRDNYRLYAWGAPRPTEAKP